MNARSTVWVAVAVVAASAHRAVPSPTDPIEPLPPLDVAGCVRDAVPPATGGAPRDALLVYSHGDPSAQEQEFLELMNRARADPRAEGARLVRDYRDPEVTAPVEHFLRLRPGVEWSRVENRRAFASYAARPPFAFNALLHEAARGHTRRMYLQSEQGHRLPGEPGIAARLHASEYAWTRGAESVFAHATSVLQAHASFAIDAGQPIQTEPGNPFEPKGRPLLGHRRAMMGFDDPVGYVEVGVGILRDERRGSVVGPVLVTVDFAVPADDARFVTGVCYEDRDADGVYDAGEGLRGLRIESSETSTSTFTSSSGGYALPVPGGRGTITVVATGEPGGPTELIGRVERTVTLDGANVKLDFVPGDEPEPPSFVVVAAPSPVPLADGGEILPPVVVDVPDPDAATASDVEVDVAFDHDDSSELRISLESPLGTRVVLADGGLPVRDLAGTFGRTLVAEQPLAAFVGEPCEGVWTLRVEDAAGGAAGTLESWALRVRPGWRRPLHFADTGLRLSKLVVRGGRAPGEGSLLVAGTVLGASTPAGGDGPLLLRFRRADGAREEILRIDATAAAAAGNGDAIVRSVGPGADRRAFRAALAGLDLPELSEVVVEVALAGAVVSERVPLSRGRYDSRRSPPGSSRFVVESIRSRPSGDGRETTVRGSFLDPAIDARGTLEVGVGTGRACLSPRALRKRGGRSSATTATPLRRFEWDRRSGAFLFRLVEDHEAVVGGSSRVFVRLGAAYGDAEVRPVVAGNSVRY